MTEPGVHSPRAAAGCQRLTNRRSTFAGMNPYEDIIDLPRPEPKGHRRMSMAKRAAQFMPFAALSGMMEMFEATRIETEKKLEK